MRINDHELNVTVAAYDNCHKIYIPIEGQEDIFISSMKNIGWADEDFFKIESVTDLMNMYLDSCPLRFIQQIDYSDGDAAYTEILPQCAFCDDDGIFDREAARKAFE